jgi:oxygen-independent coproporphyrinogen-3 oxidase
MGGYLPLVHLYIHVPFCARRCSYCDFAIAVRREVPSRKFVDAVLTEWRGWQSHSAWSSSPSLATIYLGGGTPSHLDALELGRLIRTLKRDRPVDADAEITLEANPEDVTPYSAAAWIAAGVNRVSLGVQSFDDAVLTWMHRTHDAAAVPAAMSVLRAAGFSNISVDLIFALPDALRRDWARDLDLALALEPEHLSLYGLTVEEGTPLGRWTARGESLPPPDDRYAAEYLLANRALTAAGFEHYEVSNAGLPGRRARHNSAYWKRAPFIGLGPSAHSGHEGRRSWNVREWASYERLTDAGQPVLAEQEELAPDQLRLEALYLGLRTSDGVTNDLLPEPVRNIWVKNGWSESVGDRHQLTPEGWLRLDALVRSVA